MFAILTDSNCDIVLYSLNQPPCDYNGITVGNAAGVSSNIGAEATTALGAVLGIAFAVMILLGLIVVVLGGMMLLSRRARQHELKIDVTDG